MVNPNRSGDVFGAASRASEYIEEDTIGVPSRRHQQPEVTSDGLPVLPPMPETAAPVEDSEATPTLVAPPTAAASSVEVETRPGEESVSILFGGSDSVLTPGTLTRATTGWRGSLAKMGIPITPSATEMKARQHHDLHARFEDEVRRAVWTRAVSILVANRKGGVGKTPVSILLAGTIAAIKGGSVAVLEVSDDPGALNYRAEGTPRLGLGELVRDVDQVKTAGRLKGYTAPQTSFADVIGSTGRREPLSGQDVVRVSRVIDEFYGIRVMDSGNVPTSEAFQGAVSVADVLVLPVTNAGDSVLEVLQLLELLREAGGEPRRLAENAIALRLQDGRPEDPAVKAEVERLLVGAGVVSLHEIPYDPHIAERRQLSLGKLQPSTREAFLAAAAAVIRTLQNNVAND